MQTQRWPKRRAAGSLALSLALVLGLSGCGQQATPAAAAPAQTPLASLTVANSRLAGALQQAEANNTPPPSLADATSGPVVRAAWDSAVLASIAGGTDADYAVLCGQAQRNWRAYLEFGRARAGLTQTPEDSAPMGQLVDANVARFTPEMTLGNVFHIDCEARRAGPYAAYLQGLTPEQRTDAVRRGAAESRAGLANMVISAVRMQTTPMSAQTRQAMLDPAVRNADTFAAAIDPSQRRAVIDAVNQALTTDLNPPARAGLERIRDTMGRDDCTGLCAF